MDERGPLTDSALDRELEAAFDVHPSTDFLARVRQRIAVEPAPARWSMRQPAAVAAAALAVAAVVWLRPASEPIRPPAPAAPERVAADVTLAPVAVPREPDAAAVAAVPARRAPIAPPRRREGSSDAATDAWEERFSAVVLADNERKALQWFGSATRIPPPQPSEITVSTQRAADERPALPPPTFEPPGMGQPAFERVSLE